MNLSDRNGHLLASLRSLFLESQGSRRLLTSLLLISLLCSSIGFIATPAASAGSCSPYSKLSCASIPITLPYTLDWSSDQGGLKDSNGVGTGATMVLASPVSAPNAGLQHHVYLPMVTASTTTAADLSAAIRVNLSSGNLTISPQPGSSSNLFNNNLGVGIATASQKIRVVTTLLNPLVGSGKSEQAGLWLGLSQSDNVRLAIVSTPTGSQLQLIQSANASTTSQLGSIQLAPQTTKVSLILETDPVDSMVTGYYSVNGGAEQLLGAMLVPSSLFSGVTLAGASAPAASFTGIFATQGDRLSSAGPAVYTFDSFTVTTTSRPAPILKFTTNTLTFNLEEGANADSSGTTLVSNYGSPAYTIARDDVPGWITSIYSTSGVANAAGSPVSVDVDSTGLAAGSYVTTLTATSPGYQSANLVVTLRVRSKGTCPAISTIDCSQVKLIPDQRFEFDAPGNGLGDATGQGMGFTMVDPPAHGQGYLPAKLVLGNGKLKITTTDGTNNTSTNSLDNALGIGLNMSNPLTIETTLVNLPTAPGGSAETGLWFGKAGVGPSGLGGTGSSDDDYIKLVVTSPSAGTWNVQALMEETGAVVAQSSSPSVSATNPITLQLGIDPINKTIAARYCTTAGCDPSTASPVRTFSNMPPEWFSIDAAGIDASVGTRSMGGILARHNTSGSPMTFSFDRFTYRAQALEAPGASGNINFNKWSFPLPNPTAMVWGPDGRLYVTEVFGTIHALTLDLENQVVLADQVISTLRTTYGGNRLTLGLTIDPTSTASNVILWASHSDGKYGGAAVNSGVITRLSGPGFTTVQSIITGLPRAYANHGTNNLHFGANGRLFIGQGGNTGGGAATEINPPSEFNNRPEQPLSSALLSADIGLANPTAFNGVCGTPLNQFGVPATCDVKVYASGLRNPYDFVLHSNGQLYLTDNGNGVSSAYPAETTAPCTSVITDTQQPIYDPGTRTDVLWRVEQGSYYGHPNPYRNECISYGGNPTADKDFPVAKSSALSNIPYMEVTTYPVGTQPDPNWHQPMFAFGSNKSANGIIEYNSDAFCGELKHDLLVNYYSQSDQVRRLQLSADGKTIASDQTLVQTAAGLVGPLPIAQDPYGNVYVGEFDGGRVTVLAATTTGCWQTTGVADLPVQLLDANGTMLGNRLYAVGGKNSSGHVRSLYIYDPYTNTWKTGASLPAAYPAPENPAVAAYNGKLYVFGGATAAFSGAIAKAAVYDPATNAWTMLADMPTARGGATAQAIGGKIYLAGGMNGTGSSVQTLEIYNPATNTWSSGPNMGTPRDNPGSAALGGKLYVFGGRTRNAAGFSNVETSNISEVYDPATNAWSAVAPMPTGRRTMVVVAVKGRAVLMGGEKTASGGTFVANEEYDPTTNTWATLPNMPSGRHGAVAGRIGNGIFVVGGGTVGGTSYTTDVDVFRYR